MVPLIRGPPKSGLSTRETEERKPGAHSGCSYWALLCLGARRIRRALLCAFKERLNESRDGHSIAHLVSLPVVR